MCVSYIVPTYVTRMCGLLTPEHNNRKYVSSGSHFSASRIAVAVHDRDYIAARYLILCSLYRHFPSADRETSAEHSSRACGVPDIQCSTE